MYSARAASSRLGWLVVVGTTVLACAQIETRDGDADGDTDGDLDADADLDRVVLPDADGDADLADAPPPTCDHPVCDLWPVCGCGAGEACVADDAGERSCAAAGVMGHGDMCVDERTDCRVGTVCAGLPGEPYHCLTYCESDGDCAEAGARSVCELRFLDDSGGLIATACSIDCDPASLAPSCDARTHCVIVLREETGELFTHCLGLAGSGTAGTPCDTANGAADCLPGHFCADAGLGEQCIRRCTFPAGSECTGIEQCRAFTEPAIIGEAEYGYCL